MGWVDQERQLAHLLWGVIDQSRFLFCSNGMVTSMALFVVSGHLLVSLVLTVLEASCLSLHVSLLLQSLIAASIFLALSLDAIVL